MEDEPRKTFTVTDRRHFTPEGDVRKADEPAARPEPRPAPAAPATAAASAPAVAAAATSAPPAAPEGGGPDEGDEGFDLPPVPTDLAGLIASLGAQAAYILSAPGSEAGALEAVRSVITLLEVLQQKTEGNRAPEEDALLRDVLYQLKMGFVARSRVTSA
jgi:hypothetical protein